MDDGYVRVHCTCLYSCAHWQNSIIEMKKTNPLGFEAFFIFCAFCFHVLLQILSKVVLKKQKEDKYTFKCLNIHRKLVSGILHILNIHLQLRRQRRSIGQRGETYFFFCLLCFNICPCDLIIRVKLIFKRKYKKKWH